MGPALGTQWSRDYLIDVPATSTLPNANLRYQEALDWLKWTKEDAAAISCLSIFDMVTLRHLYGDILTRYIQQVIVI